MGSHETSLLYAIAFNFGYPLGHDDKTTSMKTPHCCVTEHEETKMITIWKLHPNWLVFIVLQGSMHAPGGRKAMGSLP